VPDVWRTGVAATVLLPAGLRHIAQLLPAGTGGSQHISYQFLSFLDDSENDRFMLKPQTAVFADPDPHGSA
jgi:hypothetical protein